MKESELEKAKNLLLEAGYTIKKHSHYDPDKIYLIKYKTPAGHIQYNVRKKKATYIDLWKAPNPAMLAITELSVSGLKWTDYYEFIAEIKALED